MPLLEEIKARKAEILSLGEKYGIKDIRVFGSVARGEEKEDSDVDFLVNIDEKIFHDGLDYVRFKDSLEEMLKREIDLVSESGLYWMLRNEIEKDIKYL